MSNDACRFLSNKYNITSEFGRLKYRPCCYFKTSVYFDDPEFDAKVRIIQNQKFCNDCGFYGSTDIPNINPIQRSYIQVPASTATSVPIVLELTLDSDCNAACLSCNPGFSSTWRAQEFKFNLKHRLDYPDTPDVVNVAKKLFNKIDFAQVTRIEILGGEPFRSVTTDMVLEHASIYADSRNIDIMISTNGTVQPSNQTLDLMQKFKSVKLIVSVDGTNEQFAYLRYPLSWDTLIENLEFFKQHNSITYISLCYTIGVLNVLKYPEFTVWADKFFHNSPKYTGVFLNMCHGVIGLDKMTPIIKSTALDRNKNFESASKMISSISPADRYDELIKFINQWDSLRKTSWKNTFPELTNFLEQTNEQ